MELLHHCFWRAIDHGTPNMTSHYNWFYPFNSTASELSKKIKNSIRQEKFFCLTLMFGNSVMNIDIFQHSIQKKKLITLSSIHVHRTFLSVQNLCIR